ncbi:MAG: WecB/TagA/CpsF family glycosyltransferase [Patescibacteria group bacterium]
MKIDILGIKIDDTPKRDILKIIEAKLEAQEKIFIATPNPEMIILAQKDEAFKKILNSADISVPDGFGLKIGAKVLGKKLSSRIPGVDLMVDICKNGAGRYKAYLLGGEKGIARRAAENLKSKMPKLLIVGAEFGGQMDSWDNRVIIEHINAVKPDLLFVALGQGKQEKWIFKNLKYLPTVKLAMGVGGAFDFISGKIQRAPKWMRVIGMEWLWRLMLEPQRIGRIFNAVVAFPMVCWKKKSRDK